MQQPANGGLDIAFDELRDAVARLRDQESRQNTQATFVVGSASIVGGSIAGILATSAHVRPLVRAAVHMGVGVDVLLYIVVVFYAWRAYTSEAVKEFKATDFVGYVDRTGEETKRELVRARLVLYEQSAYALEKKARATNVAAAALLAEVLGLALVWVVVTILS